MRANPSAQSETLPSAARPGAASCRRKRSAVHAVCLVAASIAASTAAARPLRFEEAFATSRPTSVHYRAGYTAGDGRHRTVEGWRDGEARARRRSGDALEIYAVRPPGSAEYEMTVLDLQRQLATHIARTNLFRIGNFTEWFDLAHGLRRPKAAYRLTRGTAPAGVAERPVAACGWYDLEQQGRTHHVCWDARSQLPLQIVDAQQRTVWRVTELEVGPVAPAVFDIDTRGFVRIDANRDIERD